MHVAAVLPVLSGLALRVGAPGNLIVDLLSDAITEAGLLWLVLPLILRLDRFVKRLRHQR